MIMIWTFENKVHFYIQKFIIFFELSFFIYFNFLLIYHILSPYKISLIMKNVFM
jgi:hypothetical protein